MRDLLVSLLQHARRTNGPTRVVIAAAIMLTVVVASVAGVRASFPHFVLLDAHPDETQLPAVQAAIASAGIRFKTSSPPGPFSLWVEGSREYEARNAIALSGAMASDPRGITTNATGASSVFLGADERQQQILKRRWQETEKQLEVYNWIAKAMVTSSTPPRAALGKSEPPTVSVVLQLRGVLEPDREQRDVVATIVRSAFGVPKSNVVISDQFGRRIFDGSRDEGMDELLDFQRRSDEDFSERVQGFLDDIYGEGLAHASVHGEWTYDSVESVDESVDPSSKAPLSKMTHDSSTPEGTSRVGGAPGDPTAPSDDALVATTSETQEQYVIGRTTTYKVRKNPVLQRLSVTIRVDESIAADIDQIREAAMRIVGYDAERGDEISVSSARFHGLERDADGQPLAVEPAPVPDPPNATLELLMGRGVEILAALAFLFVLLKSLRSGRRTAATAAPKVERTADEELDVDLLARKRVEELLRTEPDRVAALLSRWAFEETAGARTR